nr:zinc finger protein isoform X2 [Ciona intestinalis]|eukprot:XP_009862110.1 zinc finger protein isoform X2 [Ciona intestinalis]
MESHTTATLSASGANVAAISNSHLAVGQLPSMQPLPQIRDPEWLKVEVCREFQRSACKRTAEECRFAHPSKNIQVTTDGKVIACYDALKGRCTRDSCKYLHPTYQIKQQLEVNGRQTLMQNRAMLQQMLPLHQNLMQAVPQGGLVYEPVAGAAAQPMPTSLHAGLYSPAVATTVPGSSAYSVLPSDLATLNPHLMQYYPISPSPAHQIAFATPTTSHQVAAMLPAPGSIRADRLEVCRDFQRGNCTRGEFECRYGHPPDRSMIDVTDNTVTVCMDCIKGRCTREKCKYFHPPAHLQAKIRAAQNPNAAFLPQMAASGSITPQPAVMIGNGSSIGQPPLKRHALESPAITTATSTLGSSPALPPSPNSSHNAATLAALYSFNGNAALQNLTALPPHVLQSQPTLPYYPQMPIMQLYGGTGSAIAPPAAQSAPLTSYSLPVSSSNANNGSTPSYALLNGQSQLSRDYLPKLKVPNVAHDSGQPTSLTVCRDFQSGKCIRPYCRFVHVREDYVEIKDDKVTVCRNFLQGKCSRPQCKYYHFPTHSMTDHPRDHFETFTPVRATSETSPDLMGLISNGLVTPSQRPILQGTECSPI